MATHTISDKKVRAMKKLYDNCGEVWLPKKKSAARTGRPLKITADHEERLRLYLADQPDAYIKDMCKFLEGACGMLVDGSTMWRTVQRLGLQAQRVPKPKDERGFWVQTLPRDESGNVMATNNVQKRTPVKRRGEPSQNPSPGMVRQLMGRTRDFVKDYMAQAHFDVSHDYEHVRRVLALSMKIQRVEQTTYKHIKFDETITELVALMHDIDDHKYPRPHPPPPIMQTHTSLPSPPSNMDPQYPSASSIDPNLTIPPHPPPQHDPPIPPPPAIESHLITLGWPPHIAITVSIICASISYTTETQHPDIHLSALRRFPELAIVQDADRLDALGAIGIGRTFAYSGARGRELGDTMRHFEEKLVRLEGMMKTGEGKRMARVRSERLLMFKEWLAEEMGGVEGNGVGVGDVEMGEGGMGSRRGIAPVNARTRGEDPGRQSMNPIDDAGEVDGGSSEDDESCSESE